MGRFRNFVAGGLCSLIMSLNSCEKCPSNSSSNENQIVSAIPVLVTRYPQVKVMYTKSNGDNEDIYFGVVSIDSTLGNSNLIQSKLDNVHMLIQSEIADKDNEPITLTGDYNRSYGKEFLKIDSIKVQGYTISF